MVDPFTITGAIGFTAGIVGFVVGTIERIAVVSANFKDYHWRLSGYQSTLLRCSALLRVWKDTWVHQAPFSDTYHREFEQLWSPNGWQAIQVILAGIEHEDKVIREELFGPNGSDATAAAAAEHDARHWHAFVDKNLLASGIQRRLRRGILLRFIEDGRERGVVLRQLRSSVLSRVRFALFNSTKLKDAIARLLEQIENLKVLSADFFRVHVGVDVDNELSSEDIQEVTRLERRARTLWDLMSRAYAEAQHQGAENPRSWALLMRPLTTEEHHDISQLDVLEVHFLYGPNGLNAQSIAYRVSTTCYLEHADGGNELMSSMLDYLARPPNPVNEATIQESLRSLFCLFTQLTSEDQRTIATSTSLRRANAALCLVTWAALTLPSRWLDGLCACGVREAAFGALNHAVIFHKSDEQHDQGIECFCATLGNRPHLRLALMLVEIGMSSPVTLATSQHPLKFQVRKHTDDICELSEDHLLREVRLATGGSYDYKSAVEWCLRWDRRGGRCQETFGAQDARRYAEGVIQPLRQHHKMIRQQRTINVPAFYSRVQRHAANILEGLHSPRTAAGPGPGLVEDVAL